MRDRVTGRHMIVRPEDPRNDGPASKLAIQFQTTILNTPD